MTAVDGLPRSVRYIKNGEAGRWWRAAKANSQIHAGWSHTAAAQDLLAADGAALAAALLTLYRGGKRGFQQDLNQLLALVDRPSQHIWMTFEDGCMWWCTVHDGVEPNPAGESRERGHFWLKCSRPWSNQSLGGRQFAVANLPGIVTTTQGFKGTVCQPRGWAEILRLIHDEKDVDAVTADTARQAYEAAILKLVARLGPKDFELLVDLILARTGWARLQKLGGAVEGLDVEAENPATREVAFVQVKSTASQATLNDYVLRFQQRRDRYQRMIFAVHSVTSNLAPPPHAAIQLWDGPRIAELVVKLGLGDWVASRI